MTQYDNPVKKDKLAEGLDKEIGPCLEEFSSLRFLAGWFFRAMGAHKEAAVAFQEIIERRARLELNSPLPALASIELGLTFLEAGHSSKGRLWLASARKDYPEVLNCEPGLMLRVEHCLERTARDEEEENFEEARAQLEALELGHIKRRSSAGDTLRQLNFIKKLNRRRRSNSLGKVEEQEV